MQVPSNWSPSDVNVLRLAIATYLVGQMMQNSGPSKEAKVKAAFDYADLLLKG